MIMDEPQFHPSLSSSAAEVKVKKTKLLDQLLLSNHTDSVVAKLGTTLSLMTQVIQSSISGLSYRLQQPKVINKLQLVQ